MANSGVRDATVGTAEIEMPYLEDEKGASGWSAVEVRSRENLPGNKRGYRASAGGGTGGTAASAAATRGAGTNREFLVSFAYPRFRVSVDVEFLRA